MINFTAVSFSPSPSSLMIQICEKSMHGQPAAPARNVSGPFMHVIYHVKPFRTSRYLSRHVVSRAGQHARDECARPVFLKVSVKAAWPCGWGSPDIDLFLWTGRYAIAYKTPYTTFSSISPPAQAASWSFCPRKRSSLWFKPSLYRTLLCKFSNHVRPPRRTPGTQGKEIK